MNDPTSQSDGSDASFAEALEQLHEQLMAGEVTETASDLSSSIAGEDSQRFESAVRVLMLLEEISDSSPVAQIPTQSPESTAKSQVDADGKVDSEKTGDSLIPNIQHLGRFEIIEQVGRGGYGVVVHARDPDLNRDVAIKIPRLEVAMSSDARVRFQREARAAAALNHPGIVAVHETGSDNDIDYMVCEFVPGENLAEWLVNHGKPSLTDAARIVVKLADAVAHAHQRGVLHRDLKPSNVLLRSPKNGIEPAISDFGLASFVDQQNLTQSGAVVGTPAYMSPEQATGKSKNTGPGTDVYGLGTILYQLLTGRPPFDGLPLLETIRAISESDPATPRSFDPAIPKDLEAICLKCLEKEPAARYESAFALQFDLQNFLENRPVAARPVTRFERLRRWARRNPTLAMITSALFLSLTIGLIAAVVLWRSSEGHRVQAESNKSKFQTRSEELESLVDRIFQRIEQMPEISVQGMEPVRAKMLSDVNFYYTSLLSETPSDPSLQLKRADSLLRLAGLKATLTDHQGSLDGARQVFDSIPADATGKRIQQRIDALLLMSQASWNLGDPANHKTYMSEALTTARGVYTALSLPSDDDQVEFAKTLSDASRLAIDLGERTLSQQLADDSIEIWDAVDSSQLDRESLIAMINSYHVASSAYIKSENRDDARAYGQKTIDLIENALSPSDRETPEMRYLLLNTYYDLGATHRANFEQSMPYFDQALLIAIALSDQHPLVPRYQRKKILVQYQRALEHFIIGNYQKFREDSDDHLRKALQMYQAELKNTQGLLSQYPDDRQQFIPILSDIWTMIGLIQLEFENLEAGLPALEESLHWAEQYHEDVASLGSHLKVLGVQGSLARAYNNLNRYEEAIATYGTALDGYAEILASDPANGTARRFLVASTEMCARALHDSNRHQEALAMYRRSMDAYREGPVESMMGEEATFLVYAGDAETANERFEAFAAFQKSLLLEDAVWLNGQPPRPDRVTGALPKILMDACDVINAVNTCGRSDEPAYALVKQTATTEALESLTALEQDPEFDQDAFNTILSSDMLEPLRQTTAFEAWQADRN